MREVISPALKRQLDAAKPVDLDAMQKAAEEAMRLRLEKAAALLAEQFAKLDESEHRLIRREVALRLPERPMTSAQCQLYLDETCLGVATYMLTGKIP